MEGCVPFHRITNGIDAHRCWKLMLLCVTLQLSELVSVDLKYILDINLTSIVHIYGGSAVQELDYGYFNLCSHSLGKKKGLQQLMELPSILDYNFLREYIHMGL